MVSGGDVFCMNTDVVTHIAVQSANEKNADIFFQHILGCTVDRQFSLSADMSEKIFNIRKQCFVKTYKFGDMIFEVFITDKVAHVQYEHICLCIRNIQKFLGKCRTYDIKLMSLKENGKEYLFIKDFSGYVYEIK